MTTDPRTRSRAIRLLILGMIAAVCGLIDPHILAPLHRDELVQAVIVVSVVVVAVRRLTGHR